MTGARTGARTGGHNDARGVLRALADVRLRQTVTPRLIGWVYALAAGFVAAGTVLGLVLVWSASGAGGGWWWLMPLVIAGGVAGVLMVRIGCEWVLMAFTRGRPAEPSRPATPDRPGTARAESRAESRAAARRSWVPPPDPLSRRPRPDPAADGPDPDPLTNGSREATAMHDQTRQATTQAADTGATRREVVRVSAARTVRAVLGWAVQAAWWRLRRWVRAAGRATGRVMVLVAGLVRARWYPVMGAVLVVLAVAGLLAMAAAPLLIAVTGAR